MLKASSLAAAVFSCLSCASVCHAMRRYASGGSTLALHGRRDCCYVIVPSSADNCLADWHCTTAATQISWADPTLAAILSRSSPASIFSFMAASYLRLSSRIVGSYLA
eukprot:GHUV01040696.1.p1 GENE.GHUV01040696.1~~GHUV01040696.1.p1  ORF type:complete len:108 (+),score=18.50 GHUV01040696.1:148-471(+)